jgi:uncharacterized protein
MVSGNLIAFAGLHSVAAGPAAGVAAELKAREQRGEGAAETILVFDESGAQVELDLRGNAADVVARIGSAEDAGVVATARAPGRPRLGVIAREVTLLPRHWEWLSEQPGGASVALRKLVEEARRTRGESERIRRAQENAYRFMRAIAGNLAGFEEASRALFACDRAKFGAQTETWPHDVRVYALELASDAFPPAAE